MQQDQITSVSPHSSNTVVIGSRVRFYDCDRANKERDYSGNNEFYSFGKVINRRITERYMVGGTWLGGDDVVDIELPDGRISKGHFTAGVTACL